MTQGEKAQPVYVVEPSELLENGGTFRVEGGPAVRVTGLTSAALTTTDRGVTGGDSRPVYVVNDKAILSRGVQGGSGIVVTDATQAVRGVTGLVATPVWVTNGDEWPSGGSGPTPPPSGRSIDPGKMEWWDMGDTEMPSMGPNNINSGLMEHWDMGGTEMPPVWTVI